MKKCEVTGCNNKYHIGIYCKRHYSQIRRHGKILVRTIYDENEIIKHNNYAEIVLYKGKKNPKEFARGKIDINDIDRVKKYKWRVHKDGYIRNSKFALHILIMGKKRNMVTDHINHDILDNRRSNLRLCTQSENSMNRKGAKGYCWVKEKKKYRVTICVNYKITHIKYCKTKIEAKEIRRLAEKKYFGEFAPKR